MRVVGLQAWYQAQCDGQWEHVYGVVIETLDNPGWKVRIDLTGIALQDLPMERVVRAAVNHNGPDDDQDWMVCSVAGNRFEGAGGPFLLEQICDVFMEWAQARTPAPD